MKIEKRPGQEAKDEKPKSQDSGEANFVDLMEGKYDKPATDQEAIEGQTAQVEKEIQANMAMLNETVGRLPEPETVSVEKHPGLREELEKYKRNILEYRDDFLTKMGLTMVPGGLVMGIVGMPSSPDISGIEIWATYAGIGLFAAACDQTVGRINAYIKTKKHEKEILAGETN